MSETQSEQLSDDMNRYYDQFMDVMKTLGENSPEYIKGFGEFVKAGEKNGALSSKFKELISVALSVVTQCPYCVAYHVKNAIKEGATKQEIIESAMVAGVMGGGPAVAHIKLVIDACDQFN
ncbi:carboxymuconolactone decarboxylase family protein [Athalassotoga sp.]|uniref:carboxymuconolactone decarboxylase family protein n=1 Tax=Athalassotoga sp. TaxID=2022597 RepID=UPI003D06FBF8